MIYTVTWTTAAEHQLAEAWMAADNRNEITLAAYELDERLRIDPTSFGESRDRDRRFGVVSPLAVYFRVLEEDRRVHVLTVRNIARNS